MANRILRGPIDRARSHAERCRADRGHDVGLTYERDLRNGLSTEDEEEEFTRQSNEPSRRLPSRARTRSFVPAHSISSPTA